MWDIIGNSVDENLREVCNATLGTCNNIGKMAVLDAAEKVDSFFMVKSYSIPVI